MKKGLRIFLIVIAALVLISGALVAGWYLGGQRAQVITASETTNTTMRDNDQFKYPGMMGSHYSRDDRGMMGNRNDYGYGSGMGVGQGVHPGMMQGFSYANVTPLTIDQATQAAQKYLDTLNLPDLKIAEVMIFDNGAYVRVVEESTGIGAFELLVDPVTAIVTAEHGPNMMWNLKYSGLNHSSMMGGNGGGLMHLSPWDGTVPEVSAEMTVSAEQALEEAQVYLDSTIPGTVVAETADPFYGYYTIDVLKDGKIYGMLSVNGSNGQVFYHTWHGNFIELSEGE